MVFFFFLGFIFYKIGIFDVNRKNLLVVFILFTIFCLVSVLQKEEGPLRCFFISISFCLISAPLLIMQMKYQFKKSDKILGDLSYPTYILHIFFLHLGMKVVSIFSMNHLTKFIFLVLVNIIVSTIVDYIAIRLIANHFELIRNKIRGKNV